MKLLIVTQYFPPEMGQNARRLATEQFDRDKLAAQVLSRLEAVSN
ncbi:MAG: hypothetical protein ABSG22_04605 [Sedimentisphaerales bacterium]